MTTEVRTTTTFQAARTVSLEELPAPCNPEKRTYFATKSYNMPTALQYNSLNKMIASRSALRSRTPYCMSYDRPVSLPCCEPMHASKRVMFESADNIDYGYGETHVEEEPPVKRRRFERRNSKTPQMLMAMSASLLSLELMTTNDVDVDEDEDEDESLIKTSASVEDDDDEESEECWDGGLEIAEQLVKHLQERRSNRVA
jgi:hypothetical protein